MTMNRNTDPNSKRLTQMAEDDDLVLSNPSVDQLIYGEEVTDNRTLHLINPGADSRIQPGYVLDVQLGALTTDKKVAVTCPAVGSHAAVAINGDASTAINCNAAYGGKRFIYLGDAGYAAV